jgi:hypothetical protein
MSYGINSRQLDEPQSTEWTREASAAYGRSMTARSAADIVNPSREPRWYEVRNPHARVWRRASTPGVRI